MASCAGIGNVALETRIVATVSVNKLVEELATVALAQADAENRHLLRKVRGKPAMGLQLLDKLDRKSK